LKTLPLLAVLSIGAAAAFFHFSGGMRGAANAAAAGAGPVDAAVARVATAEELAAYATLELGEILVKPAGPKGLEFTEKAKSMGGKKIQVNGFMVRYPHPDPKLFVFSSTPMVLNFQEYRLADSLPPEAIHVITDVPEGKAFSFYRDEMILLGTIEYGPRTELDGRVSHLRLRLDRALDAKTHTELSLEASLAMQRERLFNAERLKDLPAS
jgi:hypothetical protein